MTDMKRITISLPDELNDAVEEMKRSDEYKNAPYSAIIRALIERGLKAKEAKA